MSKKKNTAADSGGCVNPRIGMSVYWPSCVMAITLSHVRMLPDPDSEDPGLMFTGAIASFVSTTS